MKETYFDETLRRRVTSTIELFDDELKGMCLDTIWAHLQFGWSLEVFCARLMEERRRVLAENRAQIADYLCLPGSFTEWESALVWLTRAFSQIV
jgi:hypothetical protein